MNSTSLHTVNHNLFENLLIKLNSLLLGANITAKSPSNLQEAYEWGIKKRHMLYFKLSKRQYRINSKQKKR